MIKTTQTKYSVFNSKKERLTYGNCLVACIAAILEMPIDEIPNIYTFYGLNRNEEDSPLWLDVLNIWLIHKKGLKLKRVEAFDDGGLGFSDSEYSWAIARGLSVRGLPHCIVISLRHKSDDWDPHPSREGLKEIQYYWKFVKA
jgi:hypothetical protein